MLYLESDNINDTYYKLIYKVYNEGAELIKKDGTKLKEIVPAVIKINNPDQIVITHKGRPYNPAFMIAEMIWNLCGETDKWLCQYNEQYEMYFENDKLTAGYGNRIFNNGANQFLKVAQILKKDADSSHATISIFNKDYDLDSSLFVPCISFIEFRILNNKLNMFTRMRAQDLWKGFPYDINLLIGYFKLMSKLTGIPMGTYYHDCRAIRLYDSNIKDIEAFLALSQNYEYAPSYSIDLDVFNVNNVIDQLNYYKNVISGQMDFCDVLHTTESSYWKNALLSCYIYKLIKLNDFKAAARYFEQLEYKFKLQFIIWSKRYYPNFSRHIED